MNISTLTMKNQGIELEKEIENWMDYEGASYEQIDDITVVGLLI